MDAGPAGVAPGAALEVLRAAGSGGLESLQAVSASPVIAHTIAAYLSFVRTIASSSICASQ